MIEQRGDHRFSTSNSFDSRLGSSVIDQEAPVVTRCVVYLSIVALALTGLGYDPFLRITEQKLTAEAETEAEFEGFYTGIEEEMEEEDDIEINYQPNLYLARILAPSIVCWMVFGSIGLRMVRKIVGLGHLFVSVCYLMVALSSDVNALLLGFGFVSELFWAGKMVIYYYQIAIYSLVEERFSSIIYGVVAHCLGCATLPWILNGLEESWEEIQYVINLTIALIQLIMFLPLEFCKKQPEERFEGHNSYKFPNLVVVAALGIITLSAISNVIIQWFLNNNETMLRPYLPFLPGDDFLGTFWNIAYNGISFTLLGFFCLFLSTSDVMIASFSTTFITGIVYLYFEEEIAARMILPMTAFTFGTAFAQLLYVCPPNRLPLYMGVIFTIVNLATYGYFGLLTLLWDSPDIVVIVVWAANGFFCLGLLVLCRELGFRIQSVLEPRRDDSGSFRTVITTIA
ncbi:uncharacterized protein LOC131684173 [Topomyia yanbarensis]|uniref:uncharacterized protein LOC131684173 n=1 Tax=Topomyia yanbarensis TaxID=2498891 RepID=UPI00273CE351|nr:uncharacterized protein LOC131684173 [Topomyia yanbarensis]